jgi:hypothetical protein
MAFIVALAATVLALEPLIPATARIVAGSPPRVELTNAGNQPITAWSFAVVSPNAQGGMHRELHTADVYLSEVTRGLPRSQEHLDWIQPGRSTMVPIDVAPAGATVEVVAVVLADRRALGDPQTIRSFFEHRRVERDQLREVSEIMNGVLKTQRGVAALKTIDAQLAARGGGESVPLLTAREAVAAYLAKAGSGSGQDEAADQQIRQYTAFVTKQYELAATHADPVK